MSLHVGRLLTENARLRPAAPALVDGATGASVDFAGLDARAAGMAGALAKRIAPGDRVALCAHSSVDAVAAFFAVAHAGGAVIPIPTAAPPKELAFRVGHGGARLVLVDDDTAPIAADLAGVPVVHLAELDGPAKRLEDSPDGSAMVLYTSGTTGSPKGARITHGSLCAHTAALVHHVLRLGGDDVVLGVLPLAHSYGIRMAVFAPFYAGARTVFVSRASMGGRFDAAETLAIAARHGVTWMPGVPTMFSAWGRAPGEPWPELRWALSAGAPLPAPVRDRAGARLGAPIREGYGLTEATFTAIDAPEPGEDEHEAGTVGRPVWGVEVRIVSPGERPHGSPLPVGEEGEVQVRGQNVMGGYLDDAEATRGAFDRGWLRTGDLGVLDERGRLRIVDRIKDLILRGGVNVVPAEVEEAVARFEGGRQVAVVGRPDEHAGEEIVAVVALAPGATLDRSRLADHLRVELGGAKAPRELVVIDELPVGASGKLLRRALRDALGRGELVAERLPRPRAGHGSD